MTTLNDLCFKVTTDRA